MPNELNTMKIHPAAEMLPSLARNEFDELVADIKEHGQLEPILMQDGVLLDGRNRMMACEQLGIKPRVTQYEGDDPVGRIISLNIRRRHLTDEQRVMIAAQMRREKLSTEAEKRIRAGKPCVKIAQGGRSHEKLAAETGAKPQQARNALEIIKHAPELAPAVASGKMKLAHAAKAAAKQRTPAKSKKPKKPVDKNSKEFVVKRFQRFLDFWSVQAQRVVKPIIKEYLSR